MVQHIVMWRLKEELTDAEKLVAKNTMKQKLEALVGVVEGLQSLKVGFNYKEGYYDLCLVSIHDSKEALDIYANHPEHVKVKEYVHSVVMDRTFCDSEF